MRSSTRAITFAFVHGAWHGAWCWLLLARELELLGYRSIAAHLPSDDPEAGAGRYADVVIEALDSASVPDDVVLVGHSLGGATIPLVATRRRIGRLVFLAAVVPRPGAPLVAWPPASRELVVPGFGTVIRHDEARRSTIVSSAWAREQLYHDCDASTAAWAAARLRPQAALPLIEPSPLERWPDVPCSAVVCADDRLLSPDDCRADARARLGIEAVVVPGGHSPFLAQPREIAALLAAIRESNTS